MTVINEGVKYTVIDSLTARVGNGSANYPNAVSSDFKGDVRILPRVEIANKYYEVTEVGYRAFRGAPGITNIFLPNTIKTLKTNCMFEQRLIESIIIPASVTLVESYFISTMCPKKITFLGIKEPTMINKYEDVYISAEFKGKVNVPYSYEPNKTTFLKKQIKRVNIERKTYNIQRTKFIVSSFVLIIILIEK